MTTNDTPEAVSLRGALLRYGAHDHACRADEPDCTCGLTAFWQSLPGPVHEHDWQPHTDPPTNTVNFMWCVRCGKPQP